MTSRMTWTGVALAALLPLGLAACGGPGPTYVAQQPVVIMPPGMQPNQVPGQPMVSPALGALPPSIARAFPVDGGMYTPHPGRAPTQQEMELVGEIVRPNGLANGCVVDLALNRDVFIANIPRLASLGLLNQQITQADMQRQPLSVSLAFALQASAIAAHSFLQLPGAPYSCHFRQTMIVPGNGGPQLVTLFEFDMNRSIDAQGPWPRLLTAGFSYSDANQFVAAAPNFGLGAGIMDQVRRENGA